MLGEISTGQEKFLRENTRGIFHFGSVYSIILILEFYMKDTMKEQ